MILSRHQVPFQASRYLSQGAKRVYVEATIAKINQERLMIDLHHTCQWGTGIRWGAGSTETGMRRLALSDDDKLARDWFVDTTKSLGCKVTIDSMGNTFAVRPGLQEGPPTFAGSHLDTQPSGGRYDGILGIHSAVEMLKTLNDNWIETEYPVGVVNWTNEEGARFPLTTAGSAVWAGRVSLEEGHKLREVGDGGATQKSELERIGYMGTTPASYKDIPMAAHFELHIEQGPLLESAGMKIGVVQGAQSYRWFTVEVFGRDCHTGTTPYEARSDPLLVAAKMILQSHRIGTRLGARISTGILDLKPGSTNTVPNYVRFTLDVRASEDATVTAAEEEIRRIFKKISTGEDVDGMNRDTTTGRPCGLKITLDSTSPAVKFHHDCIACVTGAATDLFGDNAAELMTTLTSGAGHDTVNTSYICPSSMIFIPCKDGISHNPAEYSSAEECGIGAQILMQSVLRYDKGRVERSHSSGLP